MLTKEAFFLIVLVVWAFLRFVLAPLQTQKLNLIHNPQSQLAQQFIAQTQIANLKYQPYWLVAVTRHLQGVIYTIYNKVIEKFSRFQERYEREIFILKDGGLVVIDWHLDNQNYDLKSEPKLHKHQQQIKEENDDKPILVCFPGLGGGTHSAYIRQVVRQCKSQYRCVVINWRNTGGLPLTTGKMYQMGAWYDFKECIDHINSKAKPSKGIYLYACSLGAICASLYLVKDNLESPVRAAAFYGTLFDPIPSNDYFLNAMWGLYSYIFGLKVFFSTKKQLNQLQQFASKEQLDSYNLVLKGKLKPYLFNIDEYIVAPMFGYKDRFDYYRQCTLKGNLGKIKVPTFYLHSIDDIVIDSTKLHG